MTVSSVPDDEIPGAEGALDTPGRRLLANLVAIPSVSGDEADAAAHLTGFFAERGREAWIDEAGNVHAPGDDSVLLTSHVDTVPGTIPVRVEDGNDELGVDGPVLWGRGSVDATGPLAAMAVAAVRDGRLLRRRRWRGGRLARRTPPRPRRRDAPDAVINGEPSGWDGDHARLPRHPRRRTYVATDASRPHFPLPSANAIQHGTWVVEPRSSRQIRRRRPARRRPTASSTVTAKRRVAVDGGTERGRTQPSRRRLAMYSFRVPPRATRSPTCAFARSIADCLDAGELT